MFSLVSDTVHAGKQAVQAEAAHLKRRAALSAAMIYLMALGVAFAIAGGAVLLAPIMGLGWSLLAGAGLLLLVGVLGQAIVSARK